jgi:hypothetical protein
MEGQESLLGLSDINPPKSWHLSDPRENTRAPSRADAPWTSRAAAKSVKTGTWRWLVLEVLFEQYETNMDGMTHDELEDYFQTTRSTPRARCAELVDMGYVEDTGKTRKNRYGKQAIVWRITDPGIDVYWRLQEES